MNKKLFSTFLLTLLITLKIGFSFGQININKPVLGFTAVCASSSFNNFSLSFVFSPVSNLQAGNVFRVELSDGSGSFANPILLTTTTATTSPVSISNFQMPTTINGTNFRIRIKSTLPAATSAMSDAFPALYKSYEQAFKINNEVASQSFCENSIYNLSITPDASGNTPTSFPQLTYLWFKNNIQIPGETGATLAVTSSGIYYCKIDYGSCPTNSQSNAVTMTTVPAQVLTINAPSTLLCGPAGIVMTSSLISSTYTYEWYKENQAIPNSNTATYTATTPGTYTLKITNNACITASNIITITSQNYILALDSGPALTIIPGQNVTLSVTTNAASPTYSWYKGGVLQTGNQSTFVINESGTYKVIVNQNSGCISQKETSVVVTYPSSYNLVVNHEPGYTSCVSSTTTLALTSFTTNIGSNVLTSGAPITYQWFKSTAISGANSNSLLVNNFANNGTYVLNVILSNGNIITSNPITVNLKFNVNPTISSNALFLCNANPTALLTPSILNNLYSYKWYKVGSALSISSSQTYSTSIEGDYYLKLGYLDCEVTTNTLSIKRAVPDLLLTPGYDSNIEIAQGETLTITASGADSYIWKIEGQPDVTTPSLTVSQPGKISLIGTFGSCTVEKIFTIVANNKVSNLFVPNAITPNNDGFNDSWIIPEEFAYKDDVEVVIFTSRQEILFQSKNYLNNWPETPVQENTVYYYKIMKDSSVLEKGTISILK